MKRSRPVLLVVPSLQEAWEDVIAPGSIKFCPERGNASCLRWWSFQRAGRLTILRRA